MLDLPPAIMALCPRPVMHGAALPCLTTFVAASPRLTEGERDGWLTSQTCHTSCQTFSHECSQTTSFHKNLSFAPCLSFSLYLLYCIPVGCAGAGATRTGTSPHDNVRTELCTCALPGEERQGGHRPEIAEMHTSKTAAKAAARPAA